MPIHSRLTTFLRNFVSPSPAEEGCSYSRDGEDIILQKLLAGSTGFFVEIGMYQPEKYSNTYAFYRKGWKGLKLDPSARTLTLLQHKRPADSGQESGIINRDGKLEFQETLDLQKVNLAIILEKHTAGRDIDFLTFEAEMQPGEVLLSNDWDKYRPKLIVAENLIPAEQEGKEQEGFENSLLHQLLADKGYRQLCNTPSSVFYVDSRQL